MPAERPVPLPPRRRRRGLVRREGKLLVDDAGPHNAVIVSFFWLLWGLRHDRQRTIANLDYLASGGIDGVRIFCEVGEYDASDSWSDRVVDTAWAADVLDEALGLLHARGLRAVVTAIADPNSRMHSEAAMRDHLDRLLAACWAWPESVLYVAVGNEWIHGGAPRENVTLLRRLGDRVRERSPFLVSLVSDLDEFDVLAGRTERKITGDGGMWDHTEQPYDLRDTERIACDEEPIGPDSSDAADSDPLRNTAHAVCAWVCRAPIYCYHPGAGIRGGGFADLKRHPPRKANFFDEPELAETLRLLVAARDFLPGDLASFGEVTHSNPRHEGAYPFRTGPLQSLFLSGFLKTYATRKDDRFAGVFLKVEQDIPLEAPAPMTVRISDLRGHVEEREVNAGERLLVDFRGAFAFSGRYR